MLITVRIRVEIQIVLIQTHSAGFHEVAGFKTGLEDQGVIFVVFELVPIWQLGVELVKLGALVVLAVSLVVIVSIDSVSLIDPLLSAGRLCIAVVYQLLILRHLHKLLFQHIFLLPN